MSKLTSNFYSKNELRELGLKQFGDNVLISKKCSIYNTGGISIGCNVRIDDFCILSGEIEIGDFVHISAYVALYASAGLRIGNFCGISPKSTIFTASDNFSGEYMISPLVPDELTNVQRAKVTLEDYVQLGTNTVVMPGVTFGEGAVTGANSLVLNNLDEWTISFGSPTKYFKERSKKCKELSIGLHAPK